MPTQNEYRNLILFAAIMYGCYLAYVAIVELLEAKQKADIATIRADLAAWQVSQLMEEARDITRRSAQERGLHD